MAKWRKFANAIKAKRTNVAIKNNSKSGGKVSNSGGQCDVSILERKELTVQPLATEATGKAKKYERTGPQEFINFPYEEVTIPNIIKACSKHFEKRLKGMSVDVLAGERGPSCSKISQLPNLKLIHVRFVLDTSYASDNLSHSQFVEPSKPSAVSRFFGPLIPPISVPCSSISNILKRKLPSPPAMKKFPKSLPVTAMLKLGKPISETESLDETIEISTFNIDEMVWSAPVSVHFAIEKEEFGRGGFRLARKATSNSPNFKWKTYVVKYFLPGTKDIITQLGETEMDHARKSVQMHSLAKHFAEQISAKVQKDGNEEVFGKAFR